jgi:hypothetical protein
LTLNGDENENMAMHKTIQENKQKQQTDEDATHATPHIYMVNCWKDS